MNKKLSNFTGVYQVAETLKFELRPIGKTEENLKKSGLLDQDFKRAEDYPGVKNFLDEQHKRFLEKVFAEINDISWQELADKIEALRANKITRDALEKTQSNYREQIVARLKADDSYNDLVKETTPSKFFNFVKKNLPADWEKIKTFDRFACYFKGYQKNRKNIYSSAAQNTSAAYRAVNENFPRFLNAVKIYKTFQDNYSDLVEEINTRTCLLSAGEDLSALLQIESYNRFLAQSGIDFFNKLIGEINYVINQYRQKNKQEKPRNLPFMPVLYKQILSDREKVFTANVFGNDNELITALQEFSTNIKSAEILGKQVDLFMALRQTLQALTEDSDLFVDAKFLDMISQKTTGSWDAFKTAMIKFAEKNIKTQEECEKYCKKAVFNFNEIKTWHISKTLEDGTVKSVAITDFWQGEYATQLFDTAEQARTNFENAITLAADTPVRQNEELVEIIKVYLDAVQNILNILKPLVVNPEYGGELNLLGVLTTFYNQLEPIIPLYNQTRNYLTKKTTDVGKIKLMFNGPTLADGWANSKEKDNLTVIFCKNNQYYLGIINPNVKPKIDFEHYTDDNVLNCYQKMVYKLLQEPKRMLPKVFFAESNIGYFSPSEHLWQRYKHGDYCKGENFDLNFCHELIDFFKISIVRHAEWSKFGFQFSPTCSYKSIDEFYREVAEQGYNLKFVNIPEADISKLVDDGKLFLFQIWNKDFSQAAWGNPNKSTLYWKAVFDPKNLANVVFKLNGKAELFLRQPAPEVPAVPTHTQGSKLLNKTIVIKINQENGHDLAVRQSIPSDIYQELYNYVNGKCPQAELSHKSLEYLQKYGILNWVTGMPLTAALNKLIVKNAPFDIIKDKRFTEKKYSFHVPITINFKSSGLPTELNGRVLAYLQDNPDVNIIGLDRGENNLIYLVLMDQQGKILEQRSLNILNGVDYQEKLSQRAQDRQAARKSWKSIGQIKDLKSGYLSGVVYEIVKMMVEKNAIVVMENLNAGFKRSRTKIEKQIYQNFERALIEKLNYLVFKDEKDLLAPGGVLNGYQLAGKFKSFKELGSQCGFIFYVPAGYTSKIDPTTGFVNIFDTKDCTGAESIKAFFEKFESIRYQADQDAFAFEFDYRKFKTYQTDYRNKWTAFSLKSAWQQEKDKNTGIFSAVFHNPTDDIKDAVSKLGSTLKDGFDLLDLIRTVKAENSTAAFFKSIFYAFKLTTALRHSSADQDRIISPVLNSAGQFFDSQNVHDNSAPDNADANGAYHIALKGLYLLRHGNNGKKMAEIPTEKWLEFAQTYNK